LKEAPTVEDWRRLLHHGCMNSPRRSLLVWQIVSGLGVVGLCLWAVLLPRAISDRAAIAQLTRAVPLSFVAIAAGLVPSVVLLVRHRELRNWNSMLVTFGIGAVAGVLLLMTWFFILPGKLS
jgi:hypothetical protein